MEREIAIGAAAVAVMLGGIWYMTNGAVKASTADDFIPGRNSSLGLELSIPGMTFKTPEHLRGFYGPDSAPSDWVAPRGRNAPDRPGLETERIMYGVPGARLPKAVTKQEAEWMYCPPAEQDL